MFSTMLCGFLFFCSTVAFLGGIVNRHDPKAYCFAKWCAGLGFFVWLIRLVIVGP
jgi:hypothetical protein